MNNDNYDQVILDSMKPNGVPPPRHDIDDMGDLNGTPITGNYDEIIKQALMEGGLVSKLRPSGNVQDRRNDTAFDAALHEIGDTVTGMVRRSNPFRDR